MRILALASSILLAAALPQADASAATGKAEAARVFVQTNQGTGRVKEVRWADGLTLDQAIAAAQNKRKARWSEAWVRRESFWTRNFRNPHSFWARLLAGEKALGFSHYEHAETGSAATPLKPGDRVYVDLAPIAVAP
jgi:hypothetical protein